MDISEISKKYKVRKLTKEDTDKIMELFGGNELYFEYCPPSPTKESILHDMKALPPRTTEEDKYYIGYFDGDKLIALLDLIFNYPDKNTAFIGLFMVSSEYQGKGLGTSLISELWDFINEHGYKYIRLGYVKGNPQALAFWRKNNFHETGTETATELYTVVLMQKE